MSHIRQYIDKDVSEQTRRLLRLVNTPSSAEMQFGLECLSDWATKL